MNNLKIFNKIYQRMMKKKKKNNKKKKMKIIFDFYLFVYIL